MGPQLGMLIKTATEYTTLNITHFHQSHFISASHVCICVYALPKVLCTCMLPFYSSYLFHANTKLYFPASCQPHVVMQGCQLHMCKHQIAFEYYIHTFDILCMYIIRVICTHKLLFIIPIISCKHEALLSGFLNTCIN